MKGLTLGFLPSVGFRLCLLASLALSFTHSSIATANEPREQDEVSVERNANDGESDITASLSKNIYRYVERQVVDLVQVPYTVQVPYQDVETYITYETRCEWVTRPVCQNERRCVWENRPRQVCRVVRRCHATPGGRVCRDIRECSTVTDRVERCDFVPVCRETRDWACRQVPVTHTRVVTRYRNETRYRTEERVRTVTDKIFERQWSVRARVQFPEGTALRSGEVESVLISLRGEEQGPRLEVQVNSPVYSYVMEGQRFNGSEVAVTLRMVPKYAPEQLGGNSIQGPELVVAALGEGEVRFSDRGNVSRVETRYHLTVYRGVGGEQIFQRSWLADFPSYEQRVPMSHPSLNREDDFRVVLSVEREGVVLSGPVRFVKEKVQAGRVDPAPYSDPNGVREFRVEGTNDQARLTFLDESPLNEKVVTRYRLKIERRLLKFLWKTTLAEVELQRRALTVGSDGRLSVLIRELPGVSARDLDKFLDSGDRLFVTVEVIRTSAQFPGSSSMTFEKEAKIRLN